MKRGFLQLSAPLSTYYSSLNILENLFYILAHLAAIE